MIGGRWEENGRGYEGTGEDAMERGDRLWYRLLFSTGAKEYFRHRLIYPVTKREAKGLGFRYRFKNRYLYLLSTGAYGCFSSSACCELGYFVCFFLFHSYFT